MSGFYGNSQLRFNVELKQILVRLVEMFSTNFKANVRYSS